MKRSLAVLVQLTLLASLTITGIDSAYASPRPHPGHLLPAGTSLDPTSATDGYTFSMRAAPAPVMEQGPITYTIQLTATDPSTNMVTISDPLPPGMVLVQASFTIDPDVEGGCSYANGVVACDLGYLSGDTTTVVTMIVQAPSVGLTTDLVNTAYFTDVQSGEASAHVTVAPYASNTAGGTVPVPVAGEQLSTNQLTFTTAEWNVEPEFLTPGVPQVDFSDHVAVLFTVFADGPNGDFGPGGDLALAEPLCVQDPCYLQQTPAVSLTMSGSAQTVTELDLLTYTINIEPGNESTSPVTLVDTLPQGVLFVNASTTRGSCSYAVGVVTCPIGLVHVTDPPVSVTITVRAPFIGSAGTQVLRNTAVLASTDPAVNGEAASTNTSVRPVDLFTLRVDPSENGTVLTSDLPPTIVCPPACFHDFVEGATVTLTVDPFTGYAFDAWAGDCLGVPTATCTLTMNGPKSASATFVAVPQHTLTVSTDGSGAGSVTSNVGGTVDLYAPALGANGSRENGAAAPGLWGSAAHEGALTPAIGETVLGGTSFSVVPPPGYPNDRPFTTTLLYDKTFHARKSAIHYLDPAVSSLAMTLPSCRTTPLSTGKPCVLKNQKIKKGPAIIKGDWRVVLRTNSNPMIFWKVGV